MVSIWNCEQCKRRSDKSTGILKCVNIQKGNMQKWTILYNINFGFSSEVISIHIDPELYTPSQNRMLKKKMEKNGKELLLWEKTDCLWMIKDLLMFCFNRPTDTSSKNRQALMHTRLFSDLIKDTAPPHRFWLAYSLIPFWLQGQCYCSNNTIAATHLPGKTTLQKS